MDPTLVYYQVMIGKILDDMASLNELIRVIVVIIVPFKDCHRSKVLLMYARIHIHEGIRFHIYHWFPYFLPNVP